MIDFLLGWVKGAFTYVAAFFAGFKYGSLREKKKQSDDIADDARKDLEIANAPNDDRTNVINWLRKDDK